jgi:hypothetical protein
MSRPGSDESAVAQKVHLRPAFNWLIIDNPVNF